VSAVPPDAATPQRAPAARDTPASALDPDVARMDGAAALPRKNGELVFAAPWEGRAFGLAVVLSDKGAYEWNDFRTRLVEQIGSADGPYYESWLAALERVVADHV